MSRDALPVLVTGIGGATLGEQVLKALLAADTEYRIIGADVVAESLGLSLVDEGYVVPMASDPEYVPRLLDICAENGIRAMIPTSEAELRVVSAARQQFADAGVFLPINRHEIINAGDDKFIALEQISAAGARTPIHRVVNDAAEIPEWTTYPCVLKPAFGGAGSANVFIAQTAAELAALAGYLFTLTSGLVIEEYVGTVDSEFTVAVLHDMDGRLIHSIAIQRAILAGISNRIKVPNRTGRAELGDILAISSGVSQGRIGDFPQLRAACEQLARGLDSRGPLNIQCRWVDNELVVFEINPRFSGTTLLRVLAGFNEPDLLLRREVLGEDIERRFEYRFGTVVRGLSEAFFPAQPTDTRE